MEIRNATVCVLGALIHEYVNSCAIELHQHPCILAIPKFWNMYSRYVLMFLAIPTTSVQLANLDFWNNDCVTTHAPSLLNLS